MPRYPDPEDCEWLLEELAVVLERLGPELFLSNPIVEPSSFFFPDAYTTEAGAVRAVARRLSWWAGRELEIEIDMDHAPDPVSHVQLWRIGAQPARNGRVLIEVGEVGRAEHLAGALAHVVAGAVRSLEGLDTSGSTPYRGGGEQNDEELELQLSSLTTVVLGFGLLALGAAERVHTGGAVQGNWHSYEVATERHGALSPADLAYLLAVQLVVREYDPREVKRLASHVPANARKLLRDWFAELAPRRVALLEALRLPDASTWPPEDSPTEPPEPFAVEPPTDLARPEREKRNWRRVVFRVREHRALSMATLGALAGVMGSMAMRLPPLYLVLFSTGTLITGYALGRRLGRDICSDPTCRHILEPVQERCPSCGGYIAGHISSASKRLEAEETLPTTFFIEHELDPPVDRD